MRKKFISFILIFVFALASVPAFAAEEAADETAVQENKKVSELSALGILKDMSLVEFEPERTVVKKVFYSAVYNIMTDEEESDAAVISFLNKYNIKIDEAEFRDNLKREEALSAVVCMLGYSYSAPEADILAEAANQLGLRKYITGELSKDITVGEMVNLLYAAVSEDMLTISVSTSNGRFGFERVKDVTPLNYYRDIYMVKGYVNKNGYASIVDNTPAAKGYVYIDDEDFSAGVTNAADYIGMLVISYVQYDEDEEGTILYIAPNDKYVTVTKLDAEDIISVDSGVKNIEYEYGDKVKTAKLSSVVKVIFNGKNYGDYTQEDLMPDIGSLELIDSDNDRTIDVVNVKSYKTVLVNYVSAYSKTVVSKYNDPAAVSLDEDENETVIEKNGKEIEVSEIKPNDVLLVAQSKSGSDEIIKVLVSDKQTSEKITGIDYAEKEMTAGNTSYKISQNYLDAMENEEITFANKPDIGKNYCLYLDAFGNVAYAVLQDGKIYLYTTKIWQNDGDDTYGMKALNTEGIWKSYAWAEKVRLNGSVPQLTNGDEIVSRGNSALYKILTETGVDSSEKAQFAPQLLRVEFNSDGEIKSIETAEASNVYSENKFTKYDMARDRIYMNDGMTFGCDVYGTKETKVFILPTDSNAGEDQYQITNMSWFQLDKWYQVSAYDIDKFYRTPLIAYKSDAKKVGNTFYFIQNISSVLVEDEERTSVECLIKGDKAELVTASGYTLPEVKVGDVIRISTNINGEITYAEVYTDINKEFKAEYPSVTDPTKIHASLAFASGIVKEIGISEEMFLADCGLETPARFKFLGTTQCYLYDGKEKEKLRAVTPSDISPGDRVYVYISYAKANIVYAVRNLK